MTAPNKQVLILILLSFLISASVGAEEPNSSAAGKSQKAAEDDDYSESAFSGYGEFHQTREEEEDTNFFQNGRFFGVSLGVGFQFVDGNRGALWQGGFPGFDFKVHYWFDFNVAMDLGFSTATHYYDTQTLGLGHVDVNIFRVGLDVKYYFDTKNMSAPISFANPYILAGGGSYSKTEYTATQEVPDTNTSMGITMGAGLEFVLSQRKTYFEVEGKVHFVTYKDTYTTTFQSSGLSDLTGNFYTLTGNLLFTW